MSWSVSGDPTITYVTTLPEDGEITKVQNIAGGVFWITNMLLQVGGVQKMTEIVCVFVSGRSIMYIKFAQDD